jgi:hypothetical protein
MWSNYKIIDVGEFKTKAGDGCSDTSFFEAAGAVSKIGLSLKSNHHKQI